MSVPVIRLVVCNSASSWDVWGSLSSPPACGPRHVEACFILSSIDSSSLLLSRLRFGNCRAMVRGFVLNPFLCKGPVPSARFGLWASSPFPGGMPASIDVECCGPALASVQRLLVLRGSPTSVLGSGPLLRAVLGDLSIGIRCVSHTLQCGSSCASAPGCSPDRGGYIGCNCCICRGCVIRWYVRPSVPPGARLILVSCVAAYVTTGGLTFIR